MHVEEERTRKKYLCGVRQCKSLSCSPNVLVDREWSPSLNIRSIFSANVDDETRPSLTKTSSILKKASAESQGLKVLVCKSSV